MLARASASRLRTWRVLDAERRRRTRCGLHYPAPIITNGLADFHRTYDGWADVTLDFTFDGALVPIGTIEVWWRREAIDEYFSFVGTIPSTAVQFIHIRSTDIPLFVIYIMRYRNGALIGPFSEEFGVDM